MQISYSGLANSWWVHKHNLHHCSPNHVTADPDVVIPLFAFTKEQAAGKRGLARLKVKFQHLCFFPLSLLEGFVLKVDSVRYLMRNRVAHPVIEVSALILHACWFFGLPYLLLGWPRAILFILAQQAFFGLYLTLDIRSQSSGHAPVRRRDGGKLPARAGAHDSEHQESSGSRLLHWRNDLPDRTPLISDCACKQLRQVQKIVRSYCVSHGVPCHETSLFQSFREVYQDLRKNSLT